MIDSKWLARRGFSGFVSIKELRAQRLQQAPSHPGVYAVVRKSNTPPTFLSRSTGGHFKGKDPTVSTQRLEAAWISNSQILYMGKAGYTDKGPSIRQRLKQYLDFGEGRPVGHWGGRLIWQLTDANDFLIAWRTMEGSEPRVAELELLDDFGRIAGRLPFANLRR